MAPELRAFPPMALLRLTLPLWLALLGTGCQVALPKGKPEDLIAEARRRSEGKDWKGASRYCEAVRRNHEASDEAEEATFLYADASRRLLKGQRSFTAYQKLAEKWPTTRFAVDAAITQYDLGVDHLDGKFPGVLFFGRNRSFGIRILEHMQVHYRNHSLADDALMRVADWHLASGDHEAATQVLRRLLADYPRSGFTMRARFQLARSLWLQCPGADYDERLLLQARRGFEDFVATAQQQGLAESLGEQIAASQRLIAAIHETLGEKSYRIGRFYERTGHPAAAIQYYEQTLSRYGGTKSAADAAERLRRLGREAPEDGPGEGGQPG